MKGRLGGVGSYSRRNSSAQITTFDTASGDHTSLGKTGSDPVDEERTERHGRSNIKIH